jgi:hypothetical protein
MVNFELRSLRKFQDFKFFHLVGQYLIFKTTTAFQFLKEARQKSFLSHEFQIE